MPNTGSAHIDLQAIAKQVVLQHGFNPDFSPEVQQQLADLRAHPPAIAPGGRVRDLRSQLWSSIDNDTSRDLDQIEVAERLPNGDIKVMVGVADVDALVAKDSAIDKHAKSETTSVYTGVRVFSMLPEQLSTDETSLNENVDRYSIVIEYAVSKDGHILANDVYRAIVRNKAQLAYNAVGAWLEDRGPMPPKVAASNELQAQLKLQDEAAQALRCERYRHGALNIETIEMKPIMVNDKVVDIEQLSKNRAAELIEDFMIAANEVVARTLEAKK